MATPSHPTPGPLIALSAAVLLVGCGGDAGPIGPQGAQGPEGPEGPAGPAPPPSISAISPVNIYREHEDTVIVSGSGTQWGANTVLDLGAGVTVNQLTVASPTALVALVEADSTASLGPRTVTVRSAADTASFANTFRVDAPIDIEFAGSILPGARITGEATLNNPERLFPDLSGGTMFWTYVMETGEQGSVGFPSRTEAELTYLLPLNQPPGPTHFVVEELLEGTKWRSAAFDMPAPTVLPGPYGESVAGEVAEAGSSVVYGVDARAGQMIAVTVSSASGGFSSSLILPDSSHESVGQTFYAFDNATWFTTVYEFLGTGAPPYPYTLSIDTLTLTPPTLDANPTAGTLSGLFLTDVYQLDATAGEVLTVTLSDGATDSCATIDAAVLVRAPSGRAIGLEIGGCAVVTTAPVETTGTHTVFVLPNPQCACSFDYEVAATKS